MDRIGRRLAVLAALAALPLVLYAAGGAVAATPSSGSISPESPTATYTGEPLVSNPSSLVSGTPGCINGSDPSCDAYDLTIARPTDKNHEVKITIATNGAASDDYDLFVYDPAGNRIDSSTNEATPPEVVTLSNPEPGTYRLVVQAWLVDPGSTYTGTIAMREIATPPPDDPTSVLWKFDPKAAKGSATAPLRVVLVGFRPGELDESAILGKIPTQQRPGVLIPRPESGGGTCVDGGVTLGAGGTLNHGRCYYGDDEPYLVPVEYKWKPQLIYAPDAFADGLFAEMAASSTTGPLSSSTHAQWLEKYNATRGAFRGADKLVPPNSPVRFIDAEKVEDWIAANARQHLGFDIGPNLGVLGAGYKPGYTVFVLNTWDSPQAVTRLKPEHEYHYWKVTRIDPDVGEDFGVDWGRVWGGRFREVIVDLAAGPNPYESEHVLNRNRTLFGSEGYDPPLWEYRANAPRPVDPGNLVDPDTEDQAVLPGNTWNAATLHFNVGRWVNEAASFRFLHSFLYEPRPQTGRYYLSSNIWHDVNAMRPWPSDLTKLYDEEAVFSGLRTLVPYFTFQGDTAFEYLTEGTPEYQADQGMLDHAKLDGDDVAGVPGTAMHTTTAMDYFDDEANRSRFYRGGDCFTTIPNLNVVVDKHYAWDLPVVVAGIAPDRNGAPWGFLASVSDITKWPGADTDQMAATFHTDVYSGTFSYTAIHELSHYLGLAHPHDTVGASKGADGKTVYWDGFSLGFNTTAAPTTYSHDELTYSILDQDSIARAHLAYYLKWVDEALAESGEAHAAAGRPTVGDLPKLAASYRAKAIKLMKEAKASFSKFNFVKASSDAQRAWVQAAAYRDRALGLKRGTTQLDKATNATGPGGCPSATVK